MSDNSRVMHRSTCDETNSSRAIYNECNEGVVGFNLQSGTMLRFMLQLQAKGGHKGCSSPCRRASRSELRLHYITSYKTTYVLGADVLTDKILRCTSHLDIQMDATIARHPLADIQTDALPLQESS